MPTDLLPTLTRLLPWIATTALIGVVLYVVGFLALKVLRFRHALQQKRVFLELTPPAQTDRAREATQRMFSSLYGLNDGRSLKDRLLGYPTVLSFEVTSTREMGIRYIVSVAETEAPNVEHAIVSYLPEVRLRRVKDYVPTDLSTARMLDIKQHGHFAYPLRAHETFELHDPMAYLAGAMTKLRTGEMMSVQMTVSPARVPEAASIARRILHNEELLHQLGKRRLPVFGGILNVVSTIAFSVLDTFGEATSPGPYAYKTQHLATQHKQQAAMKIKPARVLSAFEQQLAESVNDKLSQPLFRVSTRAVILANDKESAARRVKGVREWLGLFTVPKYQTLKVRYNFPAKLVAYRLFLFKRRLSAFWTRNSSILSAAEATDLFHFPDNHIGKVENVIKSLSKTLPAPVSLKQNKALDVVIGRNEHHGSVTPIGLTEQERQRHVYVIGGTGNGKTTMLEYGIVQDIRNGKSVAVVDPHGDLAEKDSVAMSC
jgi:hypothetical protein